MARETQKIFGDPEIRVSATCVRVPVLRAHSEAITIECERPITPREVMTLLSGAAGVKIVDDPEKNYFPMPRDASGQDDILVGRIRQDTSDPSGKSIALFVAGDQLLKGAALNAVQIAEVIVQQGGVHPAALDPGERVEAEAAQTRVDLLDPGPEHADDRDGLASERNRPAEH